MNNPLYKGTKDYSRSETVAAIYL